MFCCTFSLSAQQDCFSALPVCFNNYNQPTGFSGSGTYEDLPAGTACFNSQESNAVWYIFTVSTPGVLQFDITPVSGSDDYDFMLFDLSSSDCADIAAGNLQPIRCNFAGTPGLATGLRAGFTDTTANVSGNAFLAPLNVQSNQTYALLVDNYTTSGQGYDLDFTNSSANILDNVNPFIDSVQNLTCDTTYTLEVYFNEPVLCASIDSAGGQFAVSSTIGAGPNVIGAYNGGCDTLTFVTSATLVLDAPILADGTNTITTLANGGLPILDICGNGMITGGTFNFNAPGIVLPQFDFSIRSSCSADTATFTNTSLPNTTNGNPTWAWDFGDAGSSTLQDPRHIYNNYQDYNVTLTATTDDNCTYSFDTTVTIVKSYLATFDWSPKPICPGETIKFYKVSNAQATTFYWEVNGPGLNDISAQDTALFTFPSPGDYDVYLEIMNNSGTTQCQADTTFTVTVNENAIAAIGVDVSQLCTSQPAQFIDSSEGLPTSWDWTFGNGDTSTEQNPTYTYTDTGTFNVTLIVGNGCEPDTATRVYEVNAEPTFDLGNDTSICYQEEVSLYAPANMDQVNWSTGETTDSIVFTDTPGEIVLSVTNEGCTYEDLIYIYELEDGCVILPIPSAFSPNNDGHNDVFQLVNPQRVQSLKVSIYNRWGELVFSDDRVDFYWDGTYRSELQDMGVFTWFIQGLGESGTGIVPFYRSGTVTLVR